MRKRLSDNFLRKSEEFARCLPPLPGVLTSAQGRGEHMGIIESPLTWDNSHLQKIKKTSDGGRACRWSQFRWDHCSWSTDPFVGPGKWLKRQIDNFHTTGIPKPAKSPHRPAIFTCKARLIIRQPSAIGSIHPLHDLAVPSWPCSWHSFFFSKLTNVFSSP